MGRGLLDLAILFVVVTVARAIWRIVRLAWQDATLRQGLEDLRREQPDAYGPDGEPLWEIPPPKWYRDLAAGEEETHTGKD